MPGVEVAARIGAAVGAAEPAEKFRQVGERGRRIAQVERQVERAATAADGLRTVRRAVAARSAERAAVIEDDRASAGVLRLLATAAEHEDRVRLGALRFTRER